MGLDAMSGTSGLKEKAFSIQRDLISRVFELVSL